MNANLKKNDITEHYKSDQLSLQELLNSHLTQWDKNTTVENQADGGRRVVNRCPVHLYNSTEEVLS